MCRDDHLVGLLLYALPIAAWHENRMYIWQQHWRLFCERQLDEVVKDWRKRGLS